MNADEAFALPAPAPEPAGDVGTAPLVVVGVIGAIGDMLMALIKAADVMLAAWIDPALGNGVLVDDPSVYCNNRVPASVYTERRYGHVLCTMIVSRGGLRPLQTVSQCDDVQTKGMRN